MYMLFWRPEISVSTFLLGMPYWYQQTAESFPVGKREWQYATVLKGWRYIFIYAYHLHICESKLELLLSPTCCCAGICRATGAPEQKHSPSGTTRSNEGRSDRNLFSPRQEPYRCWCAFQLDAQDLPEDRLACRNQDSRMKHVFLLDASILKRSVH